MSELPPPPYGLEVDVRDLDGFMLNVERLMASELVALSSHEVIGAALFLWCRAWKQIPAASLPDDEQVIAAFARLPIARFKKLRPLVLRGFYKCQDERWYHRVLAADALAAFTRKMLFQERRGKDAERLRQWRLKQDRNDSDTRSEAGCETQDETCFVREGQGQDGTGTGPKERERGGNAAADPPPPVADDPPPKPKRSRGRSAKADTEFPPDFALTPELAAHASKAGFDPPALFERFRDKALAKGWTYRDWGAAFRNFAATEHGHARAPPNRPNGAWRPPDC